MRRLYRGKALGELYGGIGRSVLFSGDPTLASTAVQALNSVGGWAQLKYRPANKLEFNAAFVSRKGPGRTVRRNRTQRVVQRRSNIGQHGGASIEFGWRLGAIEIPARE